MARDRFCLGIDIGASSVKLCKLRQSKRSFYLEQFGLEPLPSETVVDGALINSARVVEAITTLLQRHHIKSKQTAIAVSGHSVIIKKISMPKMSKQELDTSIQYEAGQFIPFDIQDVYMDVHLLEERSEQKNQMDVILVAAKKDFVNEYTSVVIEAGLEPVVCDVDAFALETMFTTNYETEEHQSVVLVNIGAAKTNINILAQGTSTFTRDLTVGGNTMTEEIQKQAGVSQEEAELLKLTSGKGSDDLRVQMAIQGVVDSLTADIQRSIDFHSATSSDPSPSQIFLTGGCAHMPLLSTQLQARVGIPIALADPFKRIHMSDEQTALVAPLSPQAAVAVGLALRFPGDS
jgi:type IV pilus assembly protein PilM